MQLMADGMEGSIISLSGKVDNLHQGQTLAQLTQKRASAQH